jgi:hypothetical protein
VRRTPKKSTLVAAQWRNLICIDLSRYNEKNCLVFLLYTPQQIAIKNNDNW